MSVGGGGSWVSVGGGGGSVGSGTGVSVGGPVEMAVPVDPTITTAVFVGGMFVGFRVAVGKMIVG